MIELVTHYCMLGFIDVNVITESFVEIEQENGYVAKFKWHLFTVTVGVSSNICLAILLMFFAGAKHITFLQDSPRAFYRLKPIYWPSGVIGPLVYA